MVDEVEILIKTDINSIISDAKLSLSLIRCYSILYVGGKAVGWCEKSQRKYYEQLIKDGIMKAKLLEEVKNRTCVPAFTGLRFICGANLHIRPEYLSDKLAIEYLEKRYLKKEDFTVLPKEYQYKLDLQEKQELSKENKVTFEVKKTDKKQSKKSKK